MFFEHLDQFVGDPVGQHHRHPRADADHLDMLDLAQLGENPVQIGIIEHQRVAAGEEHVAHLRRVADIVEPGPDLVAIRNRIDIADLALAGTVPAIHGADITDMKQHPVRVAMGYAGGRAVVVFRQRVDHVAFIDFQFMRVGKRLAKHRIVLIVAAIDQRQVVGRDRKGKLFQGQLDLAFLLRIEPDIEQGLKGLDPGDGMPELPMPIGPLG